MKTILRKASGILLAVCMLATMFAGLTAMPVSAADADMLSFDGTNAYGVVAYTTSWADIPAGDYRFEMDCKITSGTPVCYPCGRVWNSDDNNAKFSNRSYTYDEANRKYIVTFTITSDISGNFSMYIGNYDGALDGSGDAVFSCANPKLYSLDELGNATEASSIIKYDFNTYTNTKDITSSTTHKWRRLSSAGVTRSEIPDGYFDPIPAACTHESKHLVDAADSTCSTHGHNEYYACDNCDAIFNEQGDEITLADVELPLEPDAHEDEVPVAAVASTCKTPGHTAYIACSGCGAVISGSNDPLPLDPDNHVGEGTEIRDAIKATDHSTGYSGDTYCLGCGEKIADGEITPIIIRKMYHFLPGEDGWQVLVYKMSGTFPAGKYRFTIDEAAKTNIKSYVALYVNSPSYGTGVEQVADSDVLDTENNKRTVEFQLWNTKNDGAMIMFGNYGLGDNMDSYFSNPELYLLDDEGNPTGENLLDDFSEDNSVLKTGTNRESAAVGKWTSIHWTASRIQLENYNPVIFGAACGHYVKEEVEEKASTCTTPGCIAHKVCQVCGAYFDAEDNEITAEQIALPLDPENHSGEGTEYKNVVAATDDTAGYSGDIYCAGCGVKLADGHATVKQMLHFLPGDDGYQVMVYKIGGTFEAGKYRFTIDEAAKTGVKSTVNLCVNSPAYTTKVTVLSDDLDTENNKRTVTFELYGTKNDGALLLIGNYGNGEDMETYYANPELYVLDGEGNPIGENLVANFADNTVVFATGTNRTSAAAGKWTSLNWNADRVTMENYNATLYGKECKHILRTPVEAVASTCVTQGNVAYSTCNSCGAYLDAEGNVCTLEQVLLPLDANNHEGETELKNAKAASCAEAGYTGDTCCTACGGVIESGKEIAKTAHTPAAAVKENVKAATCTADGSYDEVVKCSVCGEKISSKAKTIAKLGHKPSDWKVVKAAAIGVAGSKQKVCTVCNAVLETATIDALPYPTYTITYKLDGGKNASGNPKTYKYNAADITLKNPTKKGYKFEGWYIGTRKVTKIAKGTNKNITLTAKWSKVTYKISYKLAGGKAVKNPATYTVTTSTIKLKNPTKKGYKFKGWYNGTKKVTEIKKGSTGNLTLTAKWTVITYKITYKLAGGKNNSKNPKSYKVTTSTIKLKDPTRKGYTFKGWYNGSKKVTTIKKGSIGAITLTAKWKKK